MWLKTHTKSASKLVGAGKTPPRQLELWSLVGLKDRLESKIVSRYTCNAAFQTFHKYYSGGKKKQKKQDVP